MYGDLAGFRAYHAERGNDAPTDATDAVAEAALLRGSDYIRTRYVLRFAAGDWDANADVIEAAYIAAGYEMDGTALRAYPGFWSRTYTESDRKVLTKVGEISWTVTGSGSSRYAMTPTSGMIDALLAKHLAERFPAVVVF